MIFVYFLINWVILLVVCYVLIEYGQYFLYDEVVSHIWPRALGGSLILAIALTFKKLSYLSMFGEDIAWTVGYGLLWFGVFTLLFRFQPQHGAAIGVVALLLIAGMAEMAVSSFQESVRPTTREKAPVFEPAKQGLRRSGNASGGRMPLDGGQQKDQPQPAAP